MNPPLATICPHCGQEAPIVYKGIVPTCTACGGVRPPLSGVSVNLAGKPSRLGGGIARALGWVTLVLGGSAVLGITLLLLALGWPMGALAIGLPLAIVTFVVAFALLRGGRSLADAAEQTEMAARLQAVLAMASHRGAVTAREVAQGLGMGVADADALLTALAKREPDRVAMDVDDQGVVWYRVATAPGQPLPRTRVDVGAPATAEPEEATIDDEAIAPRAARAPR